MRKGMAASFFLSIMRTFECIVNALCCCLDINKTHKLDFTLSEQSKKFDYFLKLSLFN